MMDTNILMFNSGNKSNLDRAYNKHINKVLTNLDEEQESRWETYGVIIQELIKNKKENLFKEIKYRISDGENPNEVFLSILDTNLENIDGITWILKKRIEEYLEEDFFRSFYI